jgi:predicted neutral ceramidase superfamily lipid hydrolase
MFFKPGVHFVSLFKSVLLVLSLRSYVSLQLHFFLHVCIRRPFNTVRQRVHRLASRSSGIRARQFFVVLFHTAPISTSPEFSQTMTSPPTEVFTVAAAVVVGRDRCFVFGEL